MGQMPRLQSIFRSRLIEGEVPSDQSKKHLRFRYALKNAQLQFSATALGEGLIMSYCNMGLEGLWKPELRGKIEQAIRDIASGTKSKEEARQ